MSLAYHMRLKPWDIDRLKLAEFDAFCSAIDRIGEAATDG